MKNDFVYKCHNCGVGRTFSNFLKDQDIIYMINMSWRNLRTVVLARELTPNPKFNFSPPNFVKSATGLEKISDLNIFHERESI